MIGDESRRVRGLSPAGRQQLASLTESGIVHRSAFRDPSLRPILSELVARSAVVELEGGYITSEEAVQQLLSRILPLLPADSRAVARTLGHSHGGCRAFLSHLVRRGRLQYADGLYCEVAA